MQIPALDSASALAPDRLIHLVADALDHSDDVVAVVEHDGIAPGRLRIIGVNDAFCRMAGHAEAALVGQDFLMLAWPGTEHDVGVLLSEAALAGRSLRTEMACRTAAEVKFWFGLHLMPCRDVARTFVILGRDITVRLQTNAQQREVQQLLAQVFLCADAALSIAAADGRLLMTNPRHDRLMRCKPGSLAGTFAASQLSEAARPAAAAARAKQLVDGEPYSLDTELVRGDATVVAARLTSVAAKGRDQARFRIVTLTEQPRPATTGTANAAEPAAPMRVQVAGKIKLIGLDDVKAALGRDWEKLATRALATAEHVLQKRLSRHDTYTRSEDQGFLICFSRATEDEAAFRAAMIGREIRTRLIGEGGDPASSTVTAIVASIEVPPAPAASMTAMLEERLATRRADIEAAARRSLQDAMQHAVCDIEPVMGREGSVVVAFCAGLPEAGLRRIECASAALPATEQAEFDINALTLGLAAERVLSDGPDRANRPVLVNAGFELFSARASTERFLECCARLDAGIRQRLTLMLTRLPADAAQIRVLDCMRRLRPFCRGVGFVIEDLELPPVDLATAGGPLIAISARNWGGGGAFPEARLEKLVARLHAHRGKLLVRHVLSVDASVHLRMLGVDLVSIEGSVSPPPSE